MRLLLDRTIPALRAEELPVQLPGLTGTNRAEMMRVAVQEIAEGRLDLSRGGRFIALLIPDELDERAVNIERLLEARNDDENEE